MTPGPFFFFFFFIFFFFFFFFFFPDVFLPTRAETPFEERPRNFASVSAPKRIGEGLQQTFSRSWLIENLGFRCAISPPEISRCWIKTTVFFRPGQTGHRGGSKTFAGGTQLSMNRTGGFFLFSLPEKISPVFVFFFCLRQRPARLFPAEHKILPLGGGRASQSHRWLPFGGRFLCYTRCPSTIAAN